MQLILDSLRYWVAEMHVDGFRFDLATTLARDAHGVTLSNTLFDYARRDPVLAETKLIAEPWDVGVGGYQVGGFPAGWSEWNGRFRDCVRRFWRGDQGQLPELAWRLAGSSDVFGHNGRGPTASINFVTCHDGFTLADLTSYDHRHNEDNGEGNRDGPGDEASANWGVEGPTESHGVRAMRTQMRRNFLATLFLSQGVPMLLAGDEMARSQRGNNNAYCQDNEISWVDWELGPEERGRAVHREVIGDDHLMAGLGERASQVRSNETGAAGDENPHPKAPSVRVSKPEPFWHLTSRRLR